MRYLGVIILSHVVIPTPNEITPMFRLAPSILGRDEIRLTAITR